MRRSCGRLWREWGRIANGKWTHHRFRKRRWPQKTAGNVSAQTAYAFAGHSDVRSNSQKCRNRSMLIRTHWRPLSRGMDKRENPYSLARHLIHQSIIAMWRQFARADDRALMSDHREIGQSRHVIAEQLIHPRGCVGVAQFDIVPDVDAILLGLRRPDNPHAYCADRLRRAAKSASTSSLERPCPLRAAVRAVSTLACRNVS